MASAYPGPTVTMRMPASAGPANCIDAIDIPRRAFASCSRSALTVIGVSPVDAGLKNAVPVPASACSTISSQMRAVCESSSAAVAAWIGHARNVGGEHHAAPRQAVGEDAADEQENYERGGLRGNHEAEVARGSRQVEHRPGERERRDGIAEQRHQLSR